MIAKKIGNAAYEFGIDCDLQQVANDLDISVGDMRYVDRNSCNDGITSEGFDRFVQQLRTRIVMTNYDDNTELYDYDGNPVIVCTQLYNQILIFDKGFTNKIENAITQL